MKTVHKKTQIKSKSIYKASTELKTLVCLGQDKALSRAIKLIETTYARMTSGEREAHQL